VALAPSELLAVPIAAVSAMSLVGYAYSIPAFYGPVVGAKMASHGRCFAVLRGGHPARPPDGRLLLWPDARSAGVMVRRLAPFAVLAVSCSDGCTCTRRSWSLFHLRGRHLVLTAATISASR
jgi:hypothetical protein